MLTSRRPWPGAPTGARPPSLLEPLVPEAAAARVSHSDLANAMRALAMDAVEQAKSGHPGLPMGMADVATVLFTKFLKYDAGRSALARPRPLRAVRRPRLDAALRAPPPHRVRGHDDRGDASASASSNRRRPAIPRISCTPGVETTTGPLGQGLGNAVGMAIAERMLAAEFGDELVDHCTYVLASDGDLMEGVSHEAIALAGHLRLAKLIVLFDDNDITIDGPLSLSELDRPGQALPGRWLARGARRRARSGGGRARRSTRRSAGPADADRLPHDDRLRRAEQGRHLEGAWRAARAPRRSPAPSAALGWDDAAVRGSRTTIRKAWRAGGPARPARAQGLAKASRGACRRRRAEFERRMGEAPSGARRGDRRAQGKLVAEPQKVATRKASEMALEVDRPGGARARGRLGRPDAVEQHQDQGPDRRRAGQYAGRYIHYGIREHGMAAAMNGMALHGGLHPGSARRSSSSPTMRGRRSASRRCPASAAIYVMTHDSIGLGEDGPTHQPVEHLAALAGDAEPARLPPGRRDRDGGMLAARARAQRRADRAGADPPEPAAAAHRGRPGELCAAAPTRSRRPSGEAKATLFATGSEVEIALAAQKLLAGQGIGPRRLGALARPAARPSLRPIRRRIVGDAPVKVAIEAGRALRLGRAHRPRRRSSSA